MSGHDDKAVVAQTPWKSGAGYDWGSTTVLIIRGHCLDFGSGKAAAVLAKEVAQRWNAALNPTGEA